MADEITLDSPETRIERFLAAAAGVEGITLDEPETRIEKYLYKIAQGGGGSGGGVLVVTDVDGTLDKTWQEIHDAMLSGGAALKLTKPDRVEVVSCASYDTKMGQYEVVGYSSAITIYATSSTDGYPTNA